MVHIYVKTPDEVIHDSDESRGSAIAQTKSKTCPCQPLDVLLSVASKGCDSFNMIKQQSLGDE